MVLDGRGRPPPQTGPNTDEKATLYGPSQKKYHSPCQHILKNRLH
ncbi:unnamed protein product [Spirodela intermedia]|uniref:Uncharacterized protein n=2 Tax=Spirodela intermedia TaxID=51605 RepID=A0A7I8IYH3_SPIIN|nr:unnamed protein product [Spirodela intermedia]CAA6662623.1 unnamed protein product [Spirodela intermedia]CAA7399030.1 unnamed protein product [Spirodela intermedia]